MNSRMDELRGEIDALDSKIIEILCERFEIVKQIADAKKELRSKIEDDAREREVLERCKDAAGGRLDEGFIEELTSMILSYSKKIQRMRRER